MLDRAKFLVVSEVSEVTSQSAEAVEEKVNKALERCLANRDRQLAKSKTAKADVKKTAARVAGRRTAQAS